MLSGRHLLFGLVSTLCVISAFIVCVLSFLSGCSCHRGFADACICCARCSGHRGFGVLVVTSLCLFACCSCHRGFANACSEMSVFICMLLLPSGLCRCLNFVVHAALAIRCLQLLEQLIICCTRCSCHRGFAGACGDKFVFTWTLLLPSGLCKCLNLLCTQLLPSELCSCL